MMLPLEPADHLRTVAVLDAGGESLPPEDEPSIAAAVRRLRRSQFIEAIAISASSRDHLVTWAKNNQILLVCDPPDDALARIARVAELLDADIIVRVASLSSAVDPGFVDHLVTTLLEKDCDFVLPQKGSGELSIEPFTRRALDKLMMDAHDDIVAREQVTEYFRQHPRFVRIERAGVYLAADKKARSCGERAANFPAVAAGTTSPRIAKTARAFVQARRTPGRAGPRPGNGNKPSGCRALFFCGGEVSHREDDIRRMTLLAGALRDNQQVEATFCFAACAQVPEALQRAGFAMHRLHASTAPALARVVDLQTPDILVSGPRSGLSRGALVSLRPRVPLIAALDDVSEGRLAADLAYYPPLPSNARLDWSQSRTRVQTGWEWMIVDGAAESLRPRRNLPRPTLIVSLDGKNATAQMLVSAKALATLPQGFRVRFVIPPGIADNSRLARAIVASGPNFETVEGASDLRTELDICDLALLSYGEMAYTAAARGVPALYLCDSEEDAESASAFERAGMGILLGIAAAVQEQNIASAVWPLLCDFSRRRRMSAAATASLDGQGASRIAADLVENLAFLRHVPAARLTG